MFVLKSKTVFAAILIVLLCLIATTVLAAGDAGPERVGSEAGGNASKVADVPSREEFSKDVMKIIQTDEFLEKNSPFKKGSRMYDVYARYLKELFSDQIFDDFLYTTVMSNSKYVSDYTAFGRALASDYVIHGMSRLSEKDFQELLRILNVLTAKLPAKECASMVRQGKAIQPTSLELLTVDDATRYMNVMRKALLAEISKTSMMPVNTDDQKQIAYQALQAEMKRRLTPERQELFGRIWRKLDVATDAEVCWGFRVLATGILELPDEPRRWMIREYASVMRQQPQ